MTHRDYTYTQNNIVDHPGTGVVDDVTPTKKDTKSPIQGKNIIGHSMN